MHSFYFYGKQNLQIGLVFIFNLIVGTGALTLPAVFAKAGWCLGLILIIVLAFISYMTVTFVIESMACANAVIHWRRLQFLKRDRVRTAFCVLKVVKLNVSRLLSWLRMKKSIAAISMKPSIQISVMPALNIRRSSHKAPGIMFSITKLNWAKWLDCSSTISVAYCSTCA